MDKGMNTLSDVISGTAIRALEAFFNASKSDIRVHDAEKVPGGPVLFVVNHFSRLETLFLPLVIKKYFHRDTRTLAHFSFFGGPFGSLIEKLGGLSSEDAHAERVLIRSLITGDSAALVFPEEPMIADRKLMEKGRSVIYHSGLGRAPHTRAAHLVLRAGFYREKIRFLRHSGSQEELERIMNYLSLSREDLDRLPEFPAVITPVNITYYPIRSSDNSLNRLAERILKGMPDDTRAELELEGSMILEGVDVDITFGEPINPEPYIRNSAEIEDIINSREPYLEKNAWEKAFNPGKAALQLTRLYTSAIMEMTTVNLDHILATLLAVTRRRSISEKTLRQRAWQAIENLRETEKYRLHGSLREDQLHLLADDDFDRYHSFISMAVDTGFISLKEGRIMINRGKFRRTGRSGKTRKDDIIHVLRGELRPFREIDRELIRRSLTPAFIQRRRVRNHYLDLEISTFLEDYDQWARTDTKPVNIGRPFLLKKPFQRAGVILVHGYMAAPEEMRPLAVELHRAGYAVYAARLRGHGTSPVDLNSRLWSEWYDSVNRACAIMESSVKRLAIIGFSTGAGITLLQAARKDGRFRCAVSVSAPLKLMNRKSRFSPALVAWNNILERFNLRKGRVEYLENHPENPDINYTQNPVHGVQELVRLMELVGKRLGDISIPVLVMQGRKDPVVDPESAEAIYKGIHAGGKKIIYIDSQRHGIVRGDTLGEVSEQIIRFLGKNF